MTIQKVFKLVPVEPTEKMIEGFWGEITHGEEERTAAKLAYSEMLAAAPAPPQPIFDETKERELFESNLGSMMKERNSDGSYVYLNIEDQWNGWQCCAQSRAQSVEVGHE